MNEAPAHVLRSAVARYSRVFVIVSPPRCGSTAFARTLWEHEEVRYYCHEPFEVDYFDDAGLEAVAEKLSEPLDLREAYKDEVEGEGLVIKEMPYQVGQRFPRLLDLATAPVVFLVRDPRLAIESRMRKKREVGDSPLYPLIESGWEQLLRQIEHCREHSTPFLIVDAADFRARPRAVLPRVLERLGLGYDDELLAWRSGEHLEIDNLDGRHDHLYRRVLRSRGIEPPVEVIPSRDFFPEEGGWRKHVEWCLESYDRLLTADERLRA